MNIELIEKKVDHIITHSAGAIDRIKEQLDVMDVDHLSKDQQDRFYKVLARVSGISSILDGLNELLD